MPLVLSFIGYWLIGIPVAALFGFGWGLSKENTSHPSQFKQAGSIAGKICQFIGYNRETGI